MIRFAVDVVASAVVEVVVLGVVIGTLIPALLSTVARAVTNIGTFSSIVAGCPLLTFFTVILRACSGTALGPFGILPLGPLGILLSGLLGSEGIALGDLE